ncbi:MAG: LptF/LptG family permease [Rikenellaceae bacterium]
MNIFKKGWHAIKPRIIDYYIIGKFLRTYFFAITMIIVVVVIFDAAEKIDDFLESSATMGQILTGYYLNFIPYFVNQFSGLFTFIAVIFFTSKMAYNTEIVAILSSGVSFRRLMYPYFLASLLITLFALSLNLFVIPEANTRRIAFDRAYMKQKSNSQTYDRYIYRQVEPNTFAFIRDYNAKDQRAGFFVLETYESGSIVSSLQAQDAYYNEKTGSWSAKRYSHRKFYGDVDSLYKSTAPIDTVINLIPDELGKVEELVQTMTSARLSDFIVAQKQKGSDMVALFEIEAASRYSYPIATFILTLIGVSLSSRKVRGGMGLHIGVGIGLCFSYIVLMRFAAEFAKSGVLPSIVAVWAPNFLYLLIGLYLYKKAPK